MALMECRTAEDVRRLAKRNDEWRKQQYAPKTGKPAGFGQRPPAPDPMFLAKLLNEVATKYGVTVEALKSERKFASFVSARAEFCHRAFHECDASLVRIGRALGGRDHTTIRNAIAQHCKARGLPLPSGVNWDYWVERRGGDDPPASEQSTFQSIGSVASRVVENIETQMTHDNVQES